MLWRLRGALGVGVPGAWAQGGLSPSPSPSPPQLSGHSRGCPGRARLQLTGTPSHRAVWSSPPPPPGSQRAGDSPEPAQGPRSPHGQPQPSPQPGRSWSRDCECRDQHGCLAAPCPRPTAPGMPWGAPSCCLTLRGHRPPARPSPPAGPMAASPGLPRPRSPGGAGRRRRREGESGREGWDRAVTGQERDGSSSEGRETGRGTRRAGGKWAGSGGRRSGGEEPAQG